MVRTFVSQQKCPDTIHDTHGNDNTLILEVIISQICSGINYNSKYTDSKTMQQCTNMAYKKNYDSALTHKYQKPCDHALTQNVCNALTQKPTTVH